MAAAVNGRQLRIGELVALAGTGCIIAALLGPWYESPIGRLDAWDTFGPGIVLIIAAAFAALAMVASALTERSAALPVSMAVWCVPLGLFAVIAAVVRVIERPDHATSLCYGSWLSLIGAAAILVGAWLALRDERPGLYPPADPEPRPRP
jgi:hypothetical protein